MGSYVNPVYVATGFAPLPTKIDCSNNVSVPVPPRAIASVPNDIFEAFKEVKAVPVPLWIPEILVAVNVFVPDVHVKFAFSVIFVVPLPINKRPAVKVLAPVPPRLTARVPPETLDVLIFVILEPSPLKLVAIKILFTLSHVKSPSSVIADVPLPINCKSASACSSSCHC